MYNIFILGCIGVAMNFLLERQIETLYMLTAIIIIITTTMTQCVIIGPKIVAYFKTGGSVEMKTTQAVSTTENKTEE